MRYKHDCDNCTPIGEYMDYDLYYCKACSPTIVARYGNEPDNYISNESLVLGAKSCSVHIVDTDWKKEFSIN